MEEIGTVRLVTLLFITIILAIVSCHADPDDELFSDAFLTGLWQLIKENGELAGYALFITFHSDGNYSELCIKSGSVNTDKGTWKMTGNNMVRIDYEVGHAKCFSILSLAQDKLVAIEGDRYEYEFLKL